MIRPEIVAEPLGQPQSSIDLLDVLRRQNFFQRLGFSHNRVSDENVRTAYQTQLQKLVACRGEVDEHTLCAAHKLIEAAYLRLSSIEGRIAYTDELSPDQSAVRQPSTDLLLDRYQLHTHLVTGHRSRMDIATDLRLNREVVVKRPLESLSKEHLRVFQREADLFGNMTSPYLVKLLDFDPSTGSIVMEKMKGHVVQETPRTTWGNEQVREVLSNALQGLAALHERGIIHGRIDLTHLLIDEGGQVKLSLTPGMAGRKFAMLPSSDIRHVAPELLNSRTFGQPNELVDQYALGFAMLELLCGPQFEQVNEYGDWLSWHASSSEHLPELKELEPSINEELAGLLARMCSKHAKDRYESAQACYAALVRLGTQEVAAANGKEQLALLVPPDGDAWQSEDRVELLGSPYALEEEYIAAPLQLSEVVRQPLLLLSWEARRFWLAAAIIVIGSVACLLMLLSAVSKGDSSNDNGDGISDMGALSSVEQDLETSTTDELSRVRWSVEDNSPEDESPSILAPTPESQFQEMKSDATEENVGFPKWLEIGSNASQFIRSIANTAGEFHTQPPKTELILRKRLAIPDINEEIVVFPIKGRFENPESQSEIISRILGHLNQLPLITDERLGDYAAAALNHDVDPRLTYSLALLAYEKSEFELAVMLCEQAWDEGLRHQIPFPQPLLLLNRTLARDGRLGLAVHRICLALQTLMSQPEQGTTMDQKNTRLVLIKRLGQTLGFIEHARGAVDRTQIDLESLIGQVESSMTSDERAVYLRAQSGIADQVKKILGTWEQPPQSTEGQSPEETRSAELQVSSSIDEVGHVSVSERPARRRLRVSSFESYVPFQPYITKARILRSLRFEGHTP